MFLTKMSEYAQRPDPLARQARKSAAFAAQAAARKARRSPRAAGQHHLLLPPLGHRPEPAAAGPRAPPPVRPHPRPGDGRDRRGGRPCDPPQSGRGTARAPVPVPRLHPARPRGSPVALRHVRHDRRGSAPGASVPALRGHAGRAPDRGGARRGLPDPRRGRPHEPAPGRAPPEDTPGRAHPEAPPEAARGAGADHAGQPAGAEQRAAAERQGDRPLPRDQRRAT